MLRTSFLSKSNYRLASSLPLASTSTSTSTSTSLKLQQNVNDSVINNNNNSSWKSSQQQQQQQQQRRHMQLQQHLMDTNYFAFHNHNIHNDHFHRFFSTMDTDNDDDNDDSNDNNNNNGDRRRRNEKQDAMEIFFQKRRAALKQENSQRSTSSSSSSFSLTSFRQQNKSNNDDNNNKNNNNNSMQQRRGDFNNRRNNSNNNNSNYKRQQNQRRTWDNNDANNNNNNNTNNSNNNNNNQNQGRRPQGAGWQQNIQRSQQQQQQPQQSQPQQQYQGAESNNNTSIRNNKNNISSHDGSRLTELLRELRRNAPTSKPPPSSSSSSSMDQSNSRQEQQTMSWRERFQPRTDTDQSRGDGNRVISDIYSRDNNDDKSNNTQRWKRPFLDRQGTQQKQQNQFKFRNDSDFLEGIGSSGSGNDAGIKEAATASSSSSSIEERKVTLPNAELTPSEASALFRVKIEDIQQKMRLLGSTTLDVDTMELLAMEFGIETERSNVDVIMNSEELLIKQRRVMDESNNDSDGRKSKTKGRMEELSLLPSRPPVVCIMGHVDHGKTTLMDALRRRAVGNTNNSNKKRKKKINNAKGKGNSDGGSTTDVAGTEAGGITQIISAFEVAMEGQDGKVTFLDTPGHAAFKAMRLSGTHAADVIVLVIAADDGVSAQTIEILDFYKSIVKGSDGGITMVIALNKIDKPGIDVDEAKMRIENQLLQQGIICEGMNGGDSEYGPPVQVIPTSGLTGQGLDDLMEGLILQSEMMDLRADDQALAEGIVMDARMEKGLGAVVDCIVRWGSIKKGDIVVSGTQVAKVRMLKDVNDKTMKQGLPSQPVRLIGFKSLPKAGDPIICVESEEAAEEMVEQRMSQKTETDSDRPDASTGDVEVHVLGVRSKDNARIQGVIDKANLGESNGTIRIPIIVKADADGSLSAVRDSLISLGEASKHDVVIDPVLEGIGEVTSSDIQMAKESDAVIFVFGFKKRIDQATLNLAEQLGVTIECNEIIYSLLDDAKVVFGSYLPLVPKEHIHGRAMVQAIFNVDTDQGEEKIAGLRVSEGNLYKEKGLVESSSSSSGKKPIKAHFRVMRNGKQISPKGEVVTATSLRHFKELVDSVRRGEECGLGLSGFSDFEEGDIIECYSVEMKNGTL